MIGVLVEIWLKNNYFSLRYHIINGIYWFWLLNFNNFEKDILSEFWMTKPCNNSKNILVHQSLYILVSIPSKSIKIYEGVAMQLKGMVGHKYKVYRVIRGIKYEHREEVWDKAIVLFSEHYE